MNFNTVNFLKEHMPHLLVSKVNTCQNDPKNIAKKYFLNLFIYFYFYDVNIT